jgi:uncharacterized coiled-coil protein SlyX/anti-sigma-K factor RskA
MHASDHADLALFALGVLAPEETEAVERHLAEGCEECRADLDRWRQVVAMLPFGLDVQAPDDLREEILGGSSNLPARSGAVSTRAAGRFPLLGKLFVGGFFLLLGYGVLREVDLRSRVDEQEQLVAELQVALTSAASTGEHGEVELARLRDQLAERESEVSAAREALAAAEETLGVIQGAAVDLVSLEPPDRGSKALGHLLIGREAGMALLQVFALESPPSGTVYEVWWTSDQGDPIEAGRFEPDEGGVARLRLALPEGPVGGVRISLEAIGPAGGEGPAGPVVLRGDL